ncbi:universal stress protein [Sphingobacterium thermophilum]|uniref:Universal stress protein n=1 Tax=Sphingobacterium thermophilum TaxID=768534 RepID=A0ABP8R8K1_9SPHI
MADRILIPVDFSPYSDKAIEYALQLQERSPQHIDLVHVFTEETNIYQQSLSNPELIHPKVAEAKRQMQERVKIISSTFPDIEVREIFKEGNLYTEVRKLAEQNTYNAIVMGTKGAFGLDALISGSNMYDVFLNTKLPVLAVPFQEKEFRIEKIGLLCNFKYGEIDVLKQAIKLYGTDFELILIHVNTTNDTISNIDKSFDVFIEKIIEETGIENISYVIKAQNFFVQYKEDVSSAIESVIADERLDALLVTKSKKTFLRKIIEENIVKKMAYQIHIPKFFARRIEENK